jgi:site-specific recombinase XerD
MSEGKPKKAVERPQNAFRKNSGSPKPNPKSPIKKTELVRLPAALSASLTWWVAQYFKFEVTTAASSQAVQRRDLQLLLAYVARETGGDDVSAWTPRLMRSLQESLRKELKAKPGQTARRRLADRTINRVMAHLKTFSKWIHNLKPFPLGDPMAKMTLLKVGTGLEIERAISPSERRKLLDAADLLLIAGGISKDRNRHQNGAKPRRKGYRHYRNRAIVYVLIETGMRRAAVTHIEVEQVVFQRKTITTLEKGGHSHTYQISSEGLRAVQDYLAYERADDAARWNKSPALFLPASSVAKSAGKLTVPVINAIWNEVAALAQVQGNTPHSARHAMGRHIIEKTGNVVAVQRQLGHRNAIYSLQYARITAAELVAVLEER